MKAALKRAAAFAGLLALAAVANALTASAAIAPAPVSSRFT